MHISCSPVCVRQLIEGIEQKSDQFIEANCKLFQVIRDLYDTLACYISYLFFYHEILVFEVHSFPHSLYRKTNQRNYGNISHLFKK